jgi:hypothetical protein
MRNLTSPNPIVSQAGVANAGRRWASGYGRWAVMGLLVVAPCVWAQQGPPAPSHDAPSPADLEPGVNTSATPPSEPAPPAAPVSAEKPAAPSKPAVQSKTDTTATQAQRPAQTRVAKGSSSGAPNGSKESNGSTRGGKAEDHLQLDTTDITGNQELPKVLYIVPWKRSDLGDLLGKPANSLLDEVLEPVDRDVFKRENRYYDALKPDAAAGADKAGGAAGQTSGDKR